MSFAASRRLEGMTTRTPKETVNLAALYDGAAIPWSRAERALGEGSVGPQVRAWLGTVGRDGRPHSAGIGPVALDGDVFFCASLASGKARNLAANPRCTVSLALDDLDLVLEGEAHRLHDPGVLERVVAAWRDGGWPASVADGDDGAVTAPYSAPSAGPSPWHVFRVTVDKAVGVGSTAPPGATRWIF